MPRPGLYLNTTRQLQLLIPMEGGWGLEPRRYDTLLRAAVIIFFIYFFGEFSSSSERLLASLFLQDLPQHTFCFIDAKLAACVFVYVTFLLPFLLCGACCSFSEGGLPWMVELAVVAVLVVGGVWMCTKEIEKNKERVQ